MTFVIAESCIGAKNASCVAVSAMESVYDPDTEVLAEWAHYVGKNRERNGGGTG